jgi:hypothetical protein
MAVILLPAIVGTGGFAAGSTGAAIVGGLAAVAGAYIDSLWISAAFPPPDQKGPRLNDLGIQGADEGSPVVRPYGGAVRTVGAVIWLSSLIETEHSGTVGGKGGRGAEVSQYTYSCHAAIAVCRGPISRVLKIWADSKLLYDVDTVGPVLTTDQVSTSLFTIIVFDYAGSTSDFFTFYYYCDFISHDPAVDYTTLIVGKTVIISGLTAPNTAINREWLITSTARIDASTTRFRVFKRFDNIERPIGGALNPPTNPFAPAFTVGTHTVLVDQQTTVPGWLEKTVDAIRFYTGASDQLPDALIETYEGAGDVPAWRDTAYVVFEGLQLFDFGRLPNFSFLVEENASRTLGEVFETEYALSGDDTSRIDASALTEVVDGFHVRGPQPFAMVATQLLVKYDLVTSEESGVLVLRHRSEVPTYALDESLLGAHAPGSRSPNPIETTRERRRSLPSEISVAFSNPDNDCQTTTETERYGGTTDGSTASFDLSSVVMDADDARAIALRSLWRARLNARQFKFTLPTSLIGEVQESQLITTTIEDEQVSMLTTRVERHGSGVVEVTAIEEQTQLLSLSPPTEAVSISPSLQTTNTQHRALVTAPIVSYLFECAPLRDVDADSVVLHVAVGRGSDDNAFTGAVVYGSIDDIDYREVVRIDSVCVHGYTSAALAANPSTPGSWDRTNTLDVVVTDGELVSVTELECLNGKNRAWVNGELIGFATATETSGGVYELTNLLRELRGTSGAAHLEGDVFFVLSDGVGVGAIELNRSAVGMTRYYKVLVAGQTIDDVDRTTIVPNGTTLRPMSPCNVETSRASDDAVTIGWTPRSRRLTSLLLGAPVAIDGGPFRVDFYDDADHTTLLRSVTTADLEVTYTAAQQTADGLTPGDPVYADVLQVSEHDDLDGVAAEVTVA